MSRLSYLLLAAAFFALAGSAATASRGAAGHDALITHGVVVGDVTADAAVLWARTDRETRLTVHLSGGKHHGGARLTTRAADDYTGQVVLDGLRPDTEYRYRVGSARGSFRTAPAAKTPSRSASSSEATSPARTSAGTSRRGFRSWRRSERNGRMSSSASAT